MRRKTAATRVILWTGVALVLMVILMVGISGRDFSFADIGSFGFTTSFAYDDPGEYTTAPGTISIPQGKIDQLDINWLSGEVNVTVYNGSDIQIYEEASRELKDNEVLRYRNKGDKLTIQYCESRSGFGFNNMPSKKLYVNIPASLSLNSLDIENISSSIHVQASGMYIRTVDIESVSGSIDISNLTGRELNVENVSGSLHVDGAFDSIDAQSVSGSQYYRLAYVPKGVDIESISGSISFDLPKEGGFTVRLDSVSGSISSDLAEVVGRNSATHGDGKSVFDIETVSGSVNIHHDSSLDAVAKKEVQPVVTPSPTPVGGESIPSSQRSY